VPVEPALWLELEPFDAENPFYTDVFFAADIAEIAGIIAGKGLEGLDDAAAIEAALEVYIVVVENDDNDDNGDLLDVGAWIAAEELIEADAALILGNLQDAFNVHTVTATFMDADGAVNIADLTEADFDVLIEVYDADFELAYTIVADSVVVDPVTGVATIIYTGDPIFGGYDAIWVTATLGEGDDALVYPAIAFKTWVPVLIDDNGVVDDFTLTLDPQFAANNVPPFSAPHTVTATVTDADGNVVPLAEGDVVVTATRNGTVLAPTVVINAEGEAEITVIGPANASILPPGQTLTDTIVVTVTVNDTVLEETAIKTWTGVGGGQQP
jgi:hypothetical protein